MRQVPVGRPCLNCTQRRQLVQLSSLAQIPNILHDAANRRRAKHRRLQVHALEGVDSLLARDRKIVRDVNLEELDKAFQDLVEERDQKSEANDAAPETPASSEKNAAVQAKPATGIDLGVRTAREAILQGIDVLNAGDPDRAITLFQKALELPGNGAMRFAGTVREYRCASEAEENAALYNMACAYVALGQKQPALTCLEAALDNGYDDFATLRSDPDLAALKGPDLDKLLGKHDGILAKLFGRKKKDRGGLEPIFLGF